MILTETSTQNIFNKLKKLVQILIIDSIQTLHSTHRISPGVSQIRECTSEMIKYAKQPARVFLIGISIKMSDVGPKILEHMVDTVLQFEGEETTFIGYLELLKTDLVQIRIRVYEMSQDGLREVNNLRNPNFR